MIAHHEIHEGLFLVRPQLDAARGHPVEEPVERFVGGKPRLGRGFAFFGLPPRGSEAAERAGAGGLGVVVGGG